MLCPVVSVVRVSILHTVCRVAFLYARVTLDVMETSEFVCVCAGGWVCFCGFVWKGRVYPANLFMFLYVLLSLKVLISEKLMRNNGFQWVIGPNPIFLQVQRFECITIWIKLSCLYCHSHRTYKGLCSLAGMLPSLSICPLLLKMISGPQYAHTIVTSRK